MFYVANSALFYDVIVRLSFLLLTHEKEGKVDVAHVMNFSSWFLCYIFSPKIS